MLLNKLIRHQKKLAACFLGLMIVQCGLPQAALALTSGPSQPEMKGFEPEGTNNLVDLFSGNFSYNIPLMDVGGYPLSLSYHSGSTPDDEASWVGFGWSLTPGAMNRQLRGLPDDFNGSDQVVKTQNFKDHITKGITAKVSAKFAGVPIGSVSLSAGVEYDNYRGIGTRLGANVGLTTGNLTATPDGQNNQEDDDTLPAGGGLSGGVSLGLSTSSMDGASADLNFNILKKNADKGESELSGSIGFPYSSRAGLQGMTLSESFDPGKSAAGSVPALMHLSNPELGGSSFISFAAPTYVPTIQAPTTADSYTLSLDAGGQVSLGYIGGGLSGYYTHQYIRSQDQTQVLPAYGYMNLEKGRDNPHALMDFNREKDNPYSPEVLYLPVPIPTNDLFVASGDGGGGEYTIGRGEPGVLFDPATGTNGSDFSLGVQAGFGDYFSIGGDFYYQTATHQTQKWRQNNNFLGVGDFNKQSTVNTLREHAYFKKIGEPVVTDAAYTHSFLTDTAVQVGLTGSGTTVTASNTFVDPYTTSSIPQPMGRTVREQRIQPMSYLTAAEASLGGLDKTINSYPTGQICLSGCSTCSVNQISRVGGYRQAHHLSQMTTTDKDGKRLVYGIPVYNTYQEETSFSIPSDPTKWAEGVIPYNPSVDATTGNPNGTNGYFSKQTLPPYATSYLLTAVLSPDYVDVTGNGISDDDQGTAVKFNYTQMNGLYQWRTPTDQNQANYNEGMISDPDDDKASYTYGEKEIWYLHSIESKTMVALFITEARQDAFGVSGVTGGINTSVPLQRLKEVRLYSKADIQANNGDFTKATPIKVAHFVYSYSLMPGIPNSINSTTGKLTLKEVYFTFGNNQKGLLNPYTFTYYDENTPLVYHHKQYDRWGSYKDPAANPSGMNNAEYPFTIQDTTVTNDFVSRWQLQTITLPSGGSITAHYESDDYAYVQNQRACQMCPIAGIGSVGSASGLTGTNTIDVTLPQPVGSQADLMFRYFQNMSYLYFKFYLDVDGRGDEEYVPGYAKIQSVALVNSTTAAITLTPDNVSGVGNINPVASTGWQFIRANLPKLAYPGYSNLDEPGSDFTKAIKSLGTALANLSELLPNSFPKTAKRKHFSDRADITRSFVRLCSPGFAKLGGGSRVSRIDINDQWGTMTGTTDAKTATYTNLYSYKTQTQDENGNTITISSGVAAYEPLLGGDENPFHQPIFYRQNVLLQLDRYYYVEQPYGESFYPAPNVGYSKVTVTTLGAGDTQAKDGSSVSEFYTAKDYPTQVTSLPMQKIYGQNSAILRLLFGKVVHSVGLSQGYVIENNDMHGKPKMTADYNQSGELIGSSEYYYQTQNPTAEVQQLSNNVPLVGPDGTIRNGTIGQDIQVFTDMREDISNNNGNSIRVSGGLAGFFWFPVPFFFPGPGSNYDHRSYHSSCTVKVVNNAGVLQKVVKTLNGSTTVTQNLLWDSRTGDAVLNQTQNQFDDPVYDLTLPAYWMYDGMGASYANEGTYLSGVATDAEGRVTNSAFNALLTAGDECLDLSSGTIYWVTNSDGNLRLINRDGTPVTTSISQAKVIRSGRRNLLSSGAANFVSLKNPVVGSSLDYSYATKILSTASTEYSNSWNVPAAYCQFTPPAGYHLSSDSTFFYKDTAAIASLNGGLCTLVCAGDDNSVYSVLGLNIYLPGYDTTGTGPLYCYGYQANPFWVNGACSTAPPITVTGSSAATCDLTPSTRPTSYCGPLNRTGVFSCQGDPNGDREPVGVWIGFSKVINVPATQVYYIGMGADNEFRLQIDGNTIVDRNNPNATGSNFYFWNVFPVTLTAGQHIIQFQGENDGSAGTMGMEIYNVSSPAQIMSATSYAQLDTIFSTQGMIGQTISTVGNVCSAGYTYNPNGPAATPCRAVIPINNQINPYIYGFLGNWRVVRDHVYQVNREQVLAQAELNLPGATNIRNSGAYASFNPFWQYNPGQGSWTTNPTGDIRWLLKEESTGYSTKGAEVESRDALNNYSAVLYGFLQSLPVATGSNAKYNEIAYDGFEDYNFGVQCGTEGCSPHHFDFQQQVNGNTVQVTNAVAHTGHSSLALTGPVTLTKQVYPDVSSPSYYVDATGNYKAGINPWTEGFSPVAGKQYMLSLWVKDGSPRQGTTTASISVNGNTLLNSAMTFPIVEGWKRVEVPFTLPAGSTSFSLTIQPSGTLYVDDIRIHPFNSELKTYVYDASSQRLMAELDENNFATFYEYDDEGILVRIKKETEKGIVTLKETRQSYRYVAPAQ